MKNSFKSYAITVVLITLTRGHAAPPILPVNGLPAGLGGTAQLRAIDEGVIPRIPSGPATSDGYYLVQLGVAPRAELIQSLERAGAVLYDYVPLNAFLAHIPKATLESVCAVPGIAGVFPYSTVLRVDPGLAREISAPVLSNPVLRGESILLAVEMFPNGHDASLRATIEAWEGRKLGEALLPTGRSFLIRTPAASVMPLLSVPGVKWIEKVQLPETFNSIARILCGGDAAGLRYSPSSYLFGAGEVIAIVDTGLDTGNVASLHPDFANRVLSAWSWIQGRGWADVEGHGTHVAGSAVGSGYASGADPSSRLYAGSHAGIAPEAFLSVHAVATDTGDLLGLYSLNSVLTVAYLEGARVCNNSWGNNTYGLYDYWARLVDSFAFSYPDFLMVFAAGNAGADRDGNGVVDLGSIASPASAKNVIAVGASENNETGRTSAYRLNWNYSRFGFSANPITNDSIANHPSGIAAFSSRGPTRDGRIKPDLVAPGTAIISTASSLAPDGYAKALGGGYAISNGTSMASPLVAGAAAVVRQFLRERLGIYDPPSALVKAMLLASARDLSPGQYGTGTQREIPPAPNNVEGFGRMDVAAATGPAIRVLAPNDAISQGRYKDYVITVPAGKPEMRVVLVWTDPPAAPTSSFQLVNDLDLTAYTPSNVRYISRSRRDNMETLYFANPQPGQWRFRVVGTSLKTSSQNFSLVVFWRW